MFCYYCDLWCFAIITYLWCFAIIIMTCDVLLLLPVMFCYSYYLLCFAIMTCDVLLLLRLVMFCYYYIPVMFCYYYDLWCFAIIMTCDVLLLLWPVMFCYYYYDLWCFAIMTCDVLLLLLYLWCGGRRWTGHDIQPQFLQQLGTFTNMYEYIEKLSTVWPWLAITGHDAIQKCSYWAKKNHSPRGLKLIIYQSINPENIFLKTCLTFIFWRLGHTLTGFLHIVC